MGALIHKCVSFIGVNASEPKSSEFNCNFYLVPYIIDTVI